MSALGQKQTLKRPPPMSALPPKADIVERDWNVRFVTDRRRRPQWAGDHAAVVCARPKAKPLFTSALGQKQTFR